MANVIALLVSLAASYGAGFIGSYFTLPSIEGWYAGLAKPFFSPPNWVFGPVWTLLYALMAVAAWRVWRRRKEKPVHAQFALGAYGIHLVVNTLWSIAFFGLHAPALALGVISVLLSLIGLLIWLFSRIDGIAALLLVPYFAWVSFASALNFMIMVLNARS